MTVRHLSWLVPVCGVLLLLPAPAAAQSRVPKITLDDVRVGLPALGDGSGCKIGFWLPVYVDVTCGLDPLGPADGQVVVETTDNDETLTSYRVPLPAMQPKQAETIIAYTRPGTAGSDITVSIRDPSGRFQISTPGSKPGPYAGANQPQGPGSVLYLSLGARATSLHLALADKKTDPRQGQLPVQQQPGQPVPGDAGEQMGLHYFAKIDLQRDLPNRWYGYDAVDVIVLHTGNEDFVKDLVADRTTNRKEALAEWVRRGGRLVVSLGRNQQLGGQLLEQLGLIGVRVAKPVQRTRLTGVAQWMQAGAQALAGTPRIEIAGLELDPRRDVSVLVREPAEEGLDAAERPVIVQAAAGLGRVVVVAFDLDLQPFTEWARQKDFWVRLKNEIEPRGVGNVEPQNQMYRGPRGNFAEWGGDRNDVATQFQEQKLDNFAEVPVISFGWVALFIFLYILVVGPLDYFLLKRVVKRLELTWVTFPTVVLVVSLVAYFTAYHLKGDELRMNKVDVVDVVADLGAEGTTSAATQAYGTSFFTLFSPRIQNYELGLESAYAPGAAAGARPDNPNAVVMSWMGRPENIYGGTGQSSSLSLYKRAYDYAPDASGLIGVPIPVWSTKSFSARWAGRPTADNPVFAADLAHPPGNPELLAGTVTNHLPVELQDVVVLYRRKWFSLGTLGPGETRTIDPKDVTAAKSLDLWFQTNPPQPTAAAAGSTKPVPSALHLLKPILFRELSGSNHRNTTLRYLDQSWRLKSTKIGPEEHWREEVVLVGRTAAVENAAEKVSTDGVSATRLWLGEQPQPGKQRPPLSGVLSQETFVRVFLPIAPAK